MNLIIMVILIVGVVFLLVAGFVAWLLFRGKAKYPFILHSRNGESFRIIQASLKADPENKSRKKFFLDSISYEMDVKEPTKWVGGKAHREIVPTKSGDFAYVEKTTIDEKQYIKISMSPEEKIIGLNRLKDNQRKYQNPMSKGMAGIMLGGIVLAVILIMGIVYSTVSYAGASADMVELAKENSKNSAIIQQTSNNAKLITEQLVMVAGALTGEADITRTLG